MYELKIENDQPFLRNGSIAWSKPLVDEEGNFFASSRAVQDKFKIPSSTISQGIADGHKVGGRTYHFATVSEVKRHLGDKVKPYEQSTDAKKAAERRAAERGKTKKTKKTKKTAGKKEKKGKKDPTIYLNGAVEALDTKVVFEGHVFTSGPVVLILPGTTFRMERPTKDDFPPELRDACRWS